MNAMLKVRRGDVFICNQKFTNNGSVENKTRPVVVVSNNKGNMSSTTCVVCPITSRDKTVIPSQVLYKYDGKSQVILCEQIKTVSISDLSSFVGYLSDEVMNEVDIALSIQLGLDKKEYSIEKAISFIEDTFTKVLRMKQVESKTTISEQELEDIAVRIAKTVDNLVSNENTYIIPDIDTLHSDTDIPKTEINEPIITNADTINTEPIKSHTIEHKSQIDKFNSRLQKTASINHTAIPAIDNAPAHTPGRSGKYFQTIGEIKKFLEDCDKLPIKTICDKYGMTPKKVYNQKYLCKKKMKEL